MKQQAFIIPLILAEESKELCVYELKGGNFFRDKCMNQGILPGHKITLVKKCIKGPYIINIRNTNIILGQNIARKILVTDTYL
ncbi:MAG: ferrous iron transport protein A [Spirochaetes bacterium]|nr:ferrous iron transport protein A [Spirochaetota bacterium]MBN2770375.1 ferrous iron transport protein A [Spirochaetota bacterium]